MKNYDNVFSWHILALFYQKFYIEFIPKYFHEQNLEIIENYYTCTNLKISMVVSVDAGVTKQDHIMAKSKEQMNCILT